MQIYKLKNNSLELISGDILYSLSITPARLYKIAKIGPNYKPAGKLISRPHKAVLFTAINLLNNLKLIKNDN
jgi:hypothetical protein